MYLMTYFRTEAESLHYALSEDGLNWRALNGNQPIYTSPTGEHSIRDPFVLRDQNGLYHLLSTNGWFTQSILQAVSDDLISWREAALIPVMESIEGTRNCWAPEAIYEAETGLYSIFWSSTTPLSGGENDAHGYNHRIWRVTTPDFKQFSAPEVFFDPGYNIIDATIVPGTEGGYLMAFKDERGDNLRDTPYKAIRVATSDTLVGPWTIQEHFITPALTEGPILFRAGEQWQLFFDYFMDGYFGAVCSSDGLDWHDNTAQVTFPPEPRHAAVIEIDDQLAARLE